MKEPSNYTEQIDAWLKGELTEAEHLSFEQKRIEDSDFAATVKAYQLMFEGIEYAAIKEEVKKMTAPIVAELEAEGFLRPLARVVPMKSKPKGRRIFLWILSAAASLMMLFVAVYWLFLSSSTDKNAIFNHHYLAERAEVSIQIERHESSGFASDKVRDSMLVIGLGFYKKGSYKEAQTALKNHLTIYSDESLANLYLGLSLIELKEYQEAQKILSGLVEVTNFEQNNTAKWYLALCYLQLEEAQNVEATKQLLQELAKNPNSGYTNQAKILLDDLDSF